MKYIELLGTLTYNNFTMPNIFRDIDFSVLLNSKYLKDYTIKDNDTPESIAHFYYGDRSLFWVIMIINNIHNRFYDWPMTQGVLEKMKVDMKLEGYSDADIAEFEIQNDAKRIIKTLKVEFLTQFLYQLKAQIDEVNKLKIAEETADANVSTVFSGIDSTTYGWVNPIKFKPISYFVDLSNLTNLANVLANTNIFIP